MPNSKGMPSWSGNPLLNQVISCREGGRPSSAVAERLAKIDNMVLTMGTSSVLRFGDIFCFICCLLVVNSVSSKQLHS